MIKRFEEFTKNVALAGKCISKIKAYEMKRFGLRSGNVMCLFFLGQNKDGLTPAELGEKCGEDKAGISRSLSLLCAKGYVEAEHTNKKYRARFMITESGKAVCDELNVIISDVVNAIGKDLNESERRTFYAAFASISANLQTFCAKLEEDMDE